MDFNGNPADYLWIFLSVRLPSRRGGYPAGSGMLVSPCGGWFRYDRETISAGILFWSGFACAVMTKGAASVTLVLSVGILFAWNRWRWRELGRPFVLGALLFAVLVLPWHTYMWHVFGASFLREYFGFQVLTRATSPIQGHGEPWWFYGKVLLARASPWALLFPFALFCAARRRELREYFVFAVVVLGFFTLIATKTPKYIVPAYPALAMMTGDMLAAKMEGRRRAVWIGFILALLAAFGISSIATRTLRRSLTETVASGNVVLSESTEGRDLLLAALKRSCGEKYFWPGVVMARRCGDAKAGAVVLYPQAAAAGVSRPLSPGRGEAGAPVYQSQAAHGFRYRITQTDTSGQKTIAVVARKDAVRPNRRRDARSICENRSRLRAMPAATDMVPENSGRKGEETKNRRTKIG